MLLKVSLYFWILLAFCFFCLASGANPRKWNSNQYPILTLAEARSKMGESVEPSNPVSSVVPVGTPVVAMASSNPIELKVTLQEVCRSMTRMCRTTADKSVSWFCELVICF